MFMQSNLNR